MENKKVAVLYPFFAHYRKPIVEKLDKDELIDYYFIAGEKVNVQFKALRLMDFKNYRKFISLKNIWFCKYFLIQPGVIRKIRQGKFDAIIVLADAKYLSLWALLLYCKLRNLPIFFWTHGFRTNKKSLNNNIKYIFFSLFDGGFVYDNRARDIFKEKGYKKEIDVIYNSLDFDNQNQIYKLSLKEDNLFARYGKYVVFSGRLTHTKRLEVLIDAIYILKKQKKYVNVVLIGDGVHKNELVKYVRERGVENQVYFYGSCYDERIIANCFINSIACVIPSAVGLSAIHSLTYGTPVITDDNFATHGPEIESIKDGITGKFFEQSNPNMLAAQIKYFMNLSDVERAKYQQESLSVVKEK